VNRHSVVALAAAAACLVLLFGVSPASAGVRAASSAGAVLARTWGSAEEVPGTAALNTGGNAAVESVSCPSTGTCSAGGWYTVGAGHQQAFVVSEKNGTWGTARKVPGTATLNTGRLAQVNSVSCASAGNCSAGGFYRDSSRHGHAFVVTQANGIWGTAEEVPGTAALNTGGAAQVTSVSCASAGNCSAGGWYKNRADTSRAFVVSEVHGTWGKAKQVPGITKLDAGGFAEVNSVSCAAAGTCSAGGTYVDSSNHEQAFVVNEVNGTWGTAEQVPGTTGGALVNSVSCASAGNCSAGGQAFVVSEANGTWGTAEAVPGISFALVNSVSCASAGNCSADGDYVDSSNHQQAFVVSEVNGTWGTATQVPGITKLDTGGFAGMAPVSCASAGNCSAGGWYRDNSGHLQVFVVSEVNGIWGTAEEVPGTAALNTGGFVKIDSVSCAPAGTCSAGGTYVDSTGQQAFVVNKA